VNYNTFYETGIVSLIQELTNNAQALENMSSDTETLIALAAE